MQFRSLKVWQHAQHLAIECSRVAKRFPGTDRNILADQMLRACYSVPLNIAEGSARRGPKEFRRYLDVARGSLAEVQNAIELANELGYLKQPEYERLSSLADETGRTLWGLLRKVGGTLNGHPAR